MSSGATLKKIGKVHLFHNCPVSAIACHEDNVIVATGGVDGSICLCNIKTGKVIMRLPGHDDTIEALEFSNSQPTMLASGCIGGNVQIYNLSTKLQISSMRHEVCLHPVLYLICVVILSFSVSLSAILVW